MIDKRIGCDKAGNELAAALGVSEGPVNRCLLNLASSI
jgi:hypothetical protein